MLRAVCFDVGNTLCHLDYALVATEVRRFAPHAHLDEVGQADALIRRDGWRDANACQGFFGQYFGAICARLALDPEAGRQVADALEVAHRVRPGGLWNQVDPEAEAVLTALRQAGFLLGVISNADGRVEDQIRRMGLRGHFAVVIDSARAGVQKPDPRIFALALDALGVLPAEAVHVGDIPGVDIRGAEAAGMAAVLYDRWGVHPQGSDRRIRRLGELLALLGVG